MKFISAIVAAIAVGCLSTAALSQSTAVQWTTESGGNGHWYQGLIVSQEGASWTTARTFAIARGGDLAVVPSATFAQWLFTNTVDNTTLWAQSVGPWVGGYQLTGSIEPSGGWLWANGSEILPEMWSSGQPDNYTHCGGDNNRMGYWNAGEGVPKPYLQDSPDLAVIPCIGPVISAIVEWSADCNSDGIVDYGQILSGALADANANNIPDCCEQGIPCFDLDADGVLNNLDNCPTNANPLQEDLDNDGVGDACDACPDVAGLPTCNGCPLNVCGECGIALDTDSDSTANCIDDDDDGDGVVDSADAFPLDTSESVDTDGDGIGNNADQDDDGDGADDATDGCPLDPAKSSPGQCGCGNPDTDADGDGVADCIDNCVAVANPTQADCNGNGIGEACESFTDCNANGVPDSCDLASGFAQDCNANGKPDSCDIAAGNGSPYPGAVQWTVASGGNGHWYKGVKANTLQTRAKAAIAASNAGGFLVSIGSTAESNWVYSNIASNVDLWSIFVYGFPYSTGPWIGAFLPNESSVWTWDDGSPWLFESWFPGEPNGVAPDYACYFGGHTPSPSAPFPQNKWADMWDDAITYSYIIEWNVGLPTESDCNSNGIPDSCDIASGFAQDCNGNGKPDSCDIAAGNGSPYPGAVQWTVASGGNGHWYVVLLNPNYELDWFDCKVAAEALGGHLATLGTSEENKFVFTRAAQTQGAFNNNAINAGPFLGGFQPTSASEPAGGAWRWVTEEPWTYSNWAGGQPDNFTGCGDPTGEHYLQYFYGSAVWNDMSATADCYDGCNPSYIVEWSTSLPTEPDCNSNGVPDSCEIASGAASDCNASGVPDSCESDADADGTIDACDGCPNDPAKIAAGVCGCGVADTDTDSDGTADCIDDDDDNDGVVDSADAFPLDTSESVDTDGDGQGNNADQDDDGDGADDASDGCPMDASKTAPGQCGCGSPDTDSDGDGIANCIDNCVAIANPTQDDCDGNGIGEACESFTDCNANGVPDSCDLASGFAQDCNANGKPDSCDIAAGNGSPYPGAVQWTVASGGNGHWYAVQVRLPGVSWEEADVLSRGMGGYLATIGTLAEDEFVFAVSDTPEAWPGILGPWLGAKQASGSQEPSEGWHWTTNEPWTYLEPSNWADNGKSEENYLHYMWGRSWNDATFSGDYGWDRIVAFVVEWSTGLPTESDCNANGIPDSCDITSGTASDCNASGVPDSCESDADADGTIDACDGCPNDPAKIAAGVCGCGVADTDTDSDGTADCIDDDDDNDGVVDSADAFPLDASESVDTDGDGQGNNADQDDDGDGADDASDGCPFDANKTAPGACGCGNPDTDSDGDGVANCVDNCVAVSNPTQDDCNSNGIGEACETFTDCNANSIPDSCDIASGFAQDCNANGKPDSCDLAGGGGSSNELIIDGGFEGAVWGGCPAPCFTSCGFSIAPWTRGGPYSYSEDLHRNTNAPPCTGTIVNSTGGQYFVELQGSVCCGCDNNGSIAQTLATTLGTTYQVSFDVLIDEYDRIVASIGQQSFECNPTNTPVLTWTRVSWFFVAEGPTTTLTLFSLGTSNAPDCLGASFADIDNVSVIRNGSADCNSNGIPDSCDISSGFDADCDSNGIPNSCEIAAGALDCNGNGIPDNCDVLSGGAAVDCNANGIPDSCDIASGASMDCNSNAIPDSCDIATGASNDVDSNGVPDECKPDCNNNDLPDAWEIAQGLVPDCNNNGIPDSCENDSQAASTGNMGQFGNGAAAIGTLNAMVPSTTSVTVRVEAIGDLGAPTEYATLKLGQTVVGTLLFQTTGHDCPADADVATVTLTQAQWNAIVASAGSSGDVLVTLSGSALVDAAQCGAAGMSSVSVAYGGPSYDCDGNGLSDLCEVASGTGDCNNNAILDACELLSGSAPDIDANGVIDTCQTDCNGNGLPDTYEVAQGLVPDCNGNGIPDSCDLAGGAPDCNANGIIDSCDIASGSAPDCNGNGKPDSCDISSGFAPDCNANSIPDSCDISSGTVPDCNNNGVPDSCDVASGAPDCNNNGVPDSCDVASGSSNDVDTNGVPDECKTDCNANGLPDAWEILQHLVPDCNGNSVPDSCDVADGTAKDCNENSIPDSCDIAAGEVDKNSDGQPDDCQYRYGDFDLDGNIGGSDLAVLLALWGTIDPVVGDITSDGRVDGQDLAQILARWGQIP